MLSPNDKRPVDNWGHVSLVEAVLPVFWGPETGPDFFSIYITAETNLASARILHWPKRAELRRFRREASKVSGYL